MAVQATVIASLIPFHTGSMMLCHSHVNTVPSALLAVSMAGFSVPIYQLYTARIAVLMPSQAGLIAFLYSQSAALARASQAALRAGQAVLTNQSTVAPMATLMAP